MNGTGFCYFLNILEIILSVNVSRDDYKDENHTAVIKTKSIIGHKMVITLACWKERR